MGPNQVLSALKDAMAEYQSASDEQDAAYCRQRRALNALNAAQKVFDAFVTKTHEAAPRGSDWALKAGKR